MHMKKLAILLVILMLALQGAHSQESRTEMSVDFRVNSVVIDTLHFDNADRVRHIVDYLRTISADTTIDVLEISFCGAASPEGSYQLNRRLARGRLEALERLVRSQIEIPDSIITRDDSYISWDMLREQVAASDLADRDEVLRIIDSEHTLIDYPGGRHIDSRIPELQKLSGGKTWQILLKKYFGRMRNAYAVFVTYKHQLPEPEPEPIVFPPVTEEVVEPAPAVVDTVPTPEPVEEWVRQLHIKSNLLGWGLGIVNAGVEVDLAKHWSLSVPVYYSGWDYFKETTNFRTLMVQPEVRYWLRPQNDGFFAGAHLGMAYYNIAAEGAIRYQDHQGKTPAWGGGISLGYRLPLTKDRRWRVEFTVGGGCYALKYDEYHNTDDGNGRLIGTFQKTYWGPDNVGINFSYTIDLKRRKK